MIRVSTVPELIKYFNITIPLYATEFDKILIVLRYISNKWILIDYTLVSNETNAIIRYTDKDTDNRIDERLDWHQQFKP